MITFAANKSHQLFDVTKVYGNITFQPFHHSVDMWYYNGLQLTIKPLNTNKYRTTAIVHYCQIDCSNGEPPYYVRGYNYTHNVTNQAQTTKQFFAKFVDESTAELNTLYLLKGSTMTFEILNSQDTVLETKSLDVKLVAVYIFNDAAVCDKFRIHGNKSGVLHTKECIGHFQYRTQNNNTFKFLAPADDNYCAVWQIPGNTTLHYATMVKAYYYSDNITQRGKCETLDRQVTYPDRIVNHYPIDGRKTVGTELNKILCIFIFQTEHGIDYGPIEIESVLYHTPWNLGFVISLIFFLICMLIVFGAVLYCFIVCVKKARSND